MLDFIPCFIILAHFDFGPSSVLLGNCQTFHLCKLAVKNLASHFFANWNCLYRCLHFSSAVRVVLELLILKCWQLKTSSPAVSSENIRQAQGSQPFVKGFLNLLRHFFFRIFSLRLLTPLLFLPACFFTLPNLLCPQIFAPIPSPLCPLSSSPPNLWLLSSFPFLQPFHCGRDKVRHDLPV